MSGMATNTAGAAMKLCKRIAESGLCSRRSAERLIMRGVVRVNGMEVQSALFDVIEGDQVSVGQLKLKSGSSLGKETFKVPKLWIANKLTKEKTSYDNAQQKGISMLRRFQHLPSSLTPINSLDFSTEGLCLLTDDPEFAHYLNRPYGSGAVEREFRARVHGLVSDSKLKGMKYGVKIDGVSYKPMYVTLEGKNQSVKMTKKSNTISSSNSWLRIVTKDCHPRSVKNVLDKMFIKVNRLISVRIDEYKLDYSDKGGSNSISQRVPGGASVSDTNSMPRPGEIVGPLNILDNRLLDNNSRSCGHDKKSELSNLQFNLLNFLNIRRLESAYSDRSDHVHQYNGTGLGSVDIIDDGSFTEPDQQLLRGNINASSKLRF